MSNKAPISSVNDFVVRFANVNGSGSASANELFARAVLRMGIPVAPRNIFPSNIQGLPTWYEVRISEAGHLGARGGTDLMVAMNPQTWDKDVASIEPGGYLLYDSTKPLPPSRFRDDIHVIGVPLTAICNREYTDPRQRQLFKNIIYVGALSALLDMDVSALEKLISEQFKGKEKLFDANKHALQLGRDWALLNLECPIGLRLKPSDKVGDRIFIEGNNAVALGAIYGGATVCAWYPITPSSSVAEAFTSHCRRLRVDPETKRNKFAIVQAEDELASIGMVIGASWNGARAFTATSGPGISLMQEFLGLAYFAEIPAVVIDVQRAGPSTGMPTRTQQCDILSCAYASHGDTKHVLLMPEDPAEAFEFGAQAFDLADRLQTPVFVMTDLDIGMYQRLCRPLKWDDSRKYDRGMVMTAAELLADVEVGHHEYRRLQPVGEIERLRAELERFRRVLRHQQHVLGVAVRGVGTGENVALLRAGRHAGRGTCALHVDHDRGDFREISKPKELLHQRDAGTRGRREGAGAVPGGADHHADRSQLVLGLHNRELVALGLRIDPQPPAMAGEGFRHR